MSERIISEVINDCYQCPYIRYNTKNDIKWCGYDIFEKDISIEEKEKRILIDSDADHDRIRIPDWCKLKHRYGDSCDTLKELYDKLSSFNEEVGHYSDNWYMCSVFEESLKSNLLKNSKERSALEKIILEIAEQYSYNLDQLLSLLCSNLTGYLAIIEKIIKLNDSIAEQERKI